ncbi:MAG: twin-arginine translocase TatA/TatE family subunit [Anaerolineae bacterium]|nr:MAG: twin-arginine translocase TatA/TatE family subunit [Anaerolineae bacterium]
MNFLGIGPLELVFILLFALLVFGPEDLAKAGKTLGRFMNRVVRSPEWRTFQKTTRELSTLPNRLMREANLEEFKELQKELNSIGSSLKTPPVNISSNDLAPWTTPPQERPQPSAAAPKPPAPSQSGTAAPNPPAPHQSGAATPNPPTPPRPSEQDS